jgi:hypothetical protein
MPTQRCVIFGGSPISSAAKVSSSRWIGSVIVSSAVNSWSACVSRRPPTTRRSSSVCYQ